MTFTLGSLLNSVAVGVFSFNGSSSWTEHRLPPPSTCAPFLLSHISGFNSAINFKLLIPLGLNSVRAKWWGVHNQKKWLSCTLRSMMWVIGMLVNILKRGSLTISTESRIEDLGFKKGADFESKIWSFWKSVIDLKALFKLLGLISIFEDDEWISWTMRPATYRIGKVLLNLGFRTLLLRVTPYKFVIPSISKISPSLPSPAKRLGLIVLNVVRAQQSTWVLLEDVVRSAYNTLHDERRRYRFCTYYEPTETKNEQFKRGRSGPVSQTRIQVTRPF